MCHYLAAHTCVGILLNFNGCRLLRLSIARGLHVHMIERMPYKLRLIYHIVDMLFTGPDFLRRGTTCVLLRLHLHHYTIIDRHIYRPYYYTQMSFIAYTQSHASQRLILWRIYLDCIAPKPLMFLHFKLDMMPVIQIYRSHFARNLQRQIRIIYLLL